MGRWARGRAWLVTSALLLAAMALGACAQHPQATFNPAGPVSRRELGLMSFSLWLMVGIFIAVCIPLVYAMIRFRERKGDRGLPPQIEGNHTVEIVWTVIPILICIVLAVPTIHDAFVLASPPAGSNPLVVDVVGHQWWWEFQYPGQSVVTADEMHIPTGRVIELKLTSADVLHSFWVPTLAGKEDTVPGVTNTMWLKADASGTYPGQCAEFCGTSHSLMRFDVVAQSPSQFQAWISGMQNPDVTPTTSAAKAGAKLFQEYQCGSCHTIDGTSANGLKAPNLTNLGERQVVVGGALQNTPADLAQWIHDPQSIMPDTIMPAFSTLSDQQLNDLTAYLEGLVPQK